MIERAAPAANRAVTDTDVIEIGVNLEPDVAAMAGALIGLLHLTRSRFDIPTVTLSSSLAEAKSGVAGSRKDGPLRVGL